MKKSLAIFPNGVMVASSKYQQQCGDIWKTNPTTSTSTRRLRRRPEEDQSLLKFLALNALELTAPASDVLLRHGSPAAAACNCSSSSWFQLSGHPDTFAPAGPGTIWKKCGESGAERTVYEAIREEQSLHDVTPRFLRQVHYGGQTFIELQDLLQGFRDPNVMDIKLGTRTFLESEVENLNARPDLYVKMAALDPTAPSPDEHAAKSVTKLRYMQFREQQSSTCSLGFRIEAMKFRSRPPVTELQLVKSREEVLSTLSLFIGNRDDVRRRLICRLADIRTKLEQSTYFKHHEVVGSSILIIYDDDKVGAWLIDFAKTRPLPLGVTINHRAPWQQGNHEEGFLFGLDQLINVLGEVGAKSVIDKSSSMSTSSSVALTS